MDNLALQGDGAYSAGTYVMGNLAYRWCARMDVALEYLYGEREVKDGRTGHANRMMLAFNYGY